MVPLLRLAVGRRVAPDLAAHALELLDQQAAAEARETLASPLRAAGKVSHIPGGVAPLPAVCVRVLGEFAVEVNGQTVEGGISARSRTRELLAYLAIYPEGRRREEITADLWPEAEAGQEKTLIQVTLHRLRHALFSELVIAAEGEPYRLNPAVRFDIDVRRFLESLAAARALQTTPDRRRALLQDAVEAYGGALLPSFYADWAELVRHRLERQYAAALGQLVEADWDAAEYRRCLDWCHRLLQVEPEDAAIHARIARCHERLGEPLVAVLHDRARVTNRATSEDDGEVGDRGVSAV